MPYTAPTAPRFEHRTEDSPLLGIGTATPRISWYVPEAEPEFRQRAYELEIARGAGGSQVFRVESADQVLVPWPDAPLVARESAHVRVRVGDGKDWTPWSAPGAVEVGLLSPADWTARFVTPRSLGGLDAPAPMLHGTVELPGDVASARLYITAHGLYIAELNGRRVGDQQLTPGWTSYQHRLRYQTYDVTDLLRPGRNVLGVLLGNGWYRGRLGFRGQRALYGDRLALLAQLEVTGADGRRHVLATDGSWAARDSAVLADDLYDGQRTDLRRAAGDDEPGGDPVEVLDADLGRLVAPDGPPVRITEVFPAVTVSRSPSGRLLVDFGQNLVGWVRLRVRGRPAGHEVVVRHAEVLENGELGVRPLRTARATDSYVLAGPDQTVLEPGLYPATMGATTIWERWDSMLPDGRINPGGMTSFNHYALGAVADWLYRRVAGLAPAEPGYRIIEVRPTPGPGLEWASARHLTPYGEAQVSWSRSNGRFALRLRVPVGASAAVYLPGATEPLTVGHGRHGWETDDPWSPLPGLPQQATIRDVMDHEPTWRGVVAAAVEAGAAVDEVEAAERVAPFLDASAADLVRALTADGFRPGQDFLAGRVSRILTE